ncbi:ABC1 kinase family protein [Rhodocaloribacter sp.]
MEALQDRIPPRPVEEIERRIREAWGKGTDELFASFEPAPLASASLAQVHEARLHDGRRVAVKVQYIYIEAIARMDLRTIRNILALVGALVRVRGLTAQYRQVEAMIIEELDFEEEARNIEMIAAHFEGDAGVGFPRVVHERSTRRVLTTEFIDGIKVTDLAALDAHGIDRAALAERIVTAYCRMIFTHGVYHADPHPGNIFVRPDGGIVFIDFGAVSRLTPTMQAGISEVIMGLIGRDPERILKALRQIGFVAREGHEHLLSVLIDRMYERFLSDVSLDAFRLQDIDAEGVMEAKLDMLMDFRRLGLSFRDFTDIFQVPKDWILLQRTLLLLMGLCTHLSPEMNPLQTIRPYLEEFVLGEKGGWRTLLGTVVKDLARSALTLPEEMRRFLVRTNRGEVEVRMRGLEESTRLLYILGHQLLYGFLALGAGAIAYLAHLNEEPALAQALSGVSGFFMLCLGVSLFRTRKWMRKKAARRALKT